MGMLNPELAVCRRLKLDYDSRRDSQTSLPTAPAADAAPSCWLDSGRLPDRGFALTAAGLVPPVTSVSALTDRRTGRLSSPRRSRAGARLRPRVTVWRNGTSSVKPIQQRSLNDRSLTG